MSLLVGTRQRPAGSIYVATAGTETRHVMTVPMNAQTPPIFRPTVKHIAASVQRPCAMCCTTVETRSDSTSILFEAHLTP